LQSVPKKKLQKNLISGKDALVNGGGEEITREHTSNKRENAGKLREKKSPPGRGSQQSPRKSVQQKNNVTDDEAKLRDIDKTDEAQADVSAGKRTKKRRRNKKKEITPPVADVDDKTKVDKGATEAEKIEKILQSADKYHAARLSYQNDKRLLKKTCETKLEADRKLLIQTRMSGKQVHRKEIECMDQAIELMKNIVPISNTTRLKDEEAQLHTIQKFVADDRKTECYLVRDCKCYFRLKTLIQAGVKIDSPKLRIALQSKTIRPYFEMEPNDPSTRVDMPQIVVASEMAAFMEHYADALPSSSLKLRDWNSVKPTSWGRRQSKTSPPFKSLNKTETPLSFSSSPKRVSDFQILQTLSSSEEKRPSSTSSSVNKTSLIDRTFNHVTQSITAHQMTLGVPWNVSTPPLADLSSTPYVWTMFSVLRRMVKAVESTAKSKSKPSVEEEQPTLLFERLKRKAFEMHAPDPSAANLKSLALFFSEDWCKFHPRTATRKRSPDQFPFMISYVIRLMKRRVHCFIEITNSTESDFCAVCRQPLSAASGADSSSVYCYICHIRIHLDCDVNVFELCAPRPGLSKQDLKSNRVALDDYVNSEFKPEIPALIVHIAFLIMFGDRSRIKGVYRNPQTDTKFDAFKKLLRQGWTPNLLNLEPSLMGELLKDFLNSLKPRLITEELFKKMKATKSHLKGTTKNLLEVLALCRNTFAESSTSTRETLVFLFMHLQEVHSMKEAEMTIIDLTRAFTPVLIEGFKREQSFTYYSVIECMLRLRREVWQFLFSEYVEDLWDGNEFFLL
jgi:hypothetical protein